MSLWPKLCTYQRCRLSGYLWFFPVWWWLRAKWDLTMVFWSAMFSLHRSLLLQTCAEAPSRVANHVFRINTLDTSLGESVSIWYGLYLERWTLQSKILEEILGIKTIVFKNNLQLVRSFIFFNLLAALLLLIGIIQDWYMAFSWWWQQY